MEIRGKMLVWTLLGTLVGSILTFVISAIVQDDYGGLWRKDFALTLQLVGYARGTTIPTPENVAHLVDVIQVYRKPSEPRLRFGVRDFVDSGGVDLILETREDRKRVV